LELLDDSIDDNVEDRKPHAKVVIPSREINPAPNDVSEKSMSIRVAHTNPIRVNTTNREDMMAGGVANTPDRKISYPNVCVSPETDHGNTPEPCPPPLIPQWPMQQ
jgi:hypothetical protein